jgi:hypothetical protein
MPNDDADSSRRTEKSPPSEAFALVGNEVRAEIIRVLGEDPHAGLSFSELRSRVDADVDSGGFNYHLQQLVGHFVDDAEDGYRMRAEGLTLYRAIRAGTFNRRASVDPFPAGFDCYFCGGAVEAGYEDGWFELTCPDCAHVYMHTTLPPNAVDAADEAALLSRVDAYTRHRMAAYVRGVCPVCVNGLDAELVSSEAVWAEGTDRLDVFVEHACDHCGQQHFMPVGLALLWHPAVVSFLHDHGIDVRSTPHWEFEFATTDRHVTVRDTEPWEVALTVSAGEEGLELVVDGDLTVRETARTASPR